MTDNAKAYRQATITKDFTAEHGIKQLFIRPGCPWQNGKAERLNRTLLTEWAYSQIFTSNDQRTQALAPWLEQESSSAVAAASTPAGLSTTTLNAATAHSEATHPSADCYQPDGRVQLGPTTATNLQGCSHKLPHRASVCVAAWVPAVHH